MRSPAERPERDQVVRCVQQGRDKAMAAALRSEQVCLVDDEVQRSAVLPQDRLGKVGEEAGTAGDAHLLRVEDCRRRRRTKHFSNAFAGASVERQIGMAAAEDDERIRRWPLAVAGQAQAPPYAGWINDGRRVRRGRAGARRRP